MRTSFIRGVLLGAALLAGVQAMDALTDTGLGLTERASADEGKKKPPAGATGIEWLVEPDGVEIYLDGKKIGEAGRISFTPTKPGKHAVRLVRVKDETEIDVEVKKGQILKFTFKFEDD